jgi:hypothetical protein
MKDIIPRCGAVVLIWLSALLSTVADADTTINPTNNYAYGANLGWINWRGDVTHGANIGGQVCSGYIYGANLGWINLGNGSPLNGVQYQNNNATDFGLNLDGAGNLSGYAYGANIGWITFSAQGSPKVNISTGKFSGYGYGANCGWISLSNSFAFVQSGTNSAPDAPVFKLLTLTRQSNGTIYLSGTGLPNTQYTVLVKNNSLLGNWISNGIITASSLGVIQYYDLAPGATGYSQRYYTLRSP